MHLYFIPYIGFTTGFPHRIILSILGIALIILSAKASIRKIARVFFILTGASALGMGLSVILHNLLFLFLIKLFGEGIWSLVWVKNLSSLSWQQLYVPLPTCWAVAGIFLIAKKKVSIK